MHQLSKRATWGSEDGDSVAPLLHSACLQPKQQLPGSWPVGLVESKSDDTHGVAKLKSLAQHWCVTGAVPRSSWPPDLLSNKWKLVFTIPTIRNRKEGKISSWQDRLFRLEETSCLAFQKGENSQQRKQRERGHWIRQLFFCYSNCAHVPLPPDRDDINPSPSTMDTGCFKGLGDQGANKGWDNPRYIAVKKKSCIFTKHV